MIGLFTTLQWTDQPAGDTRSRGILDGRDLPGLRAYWDFAERRPPFVSHVGRHVLGNGPGSDVRRCDDRAGGVAFNGRTDFLTIAAPALGDLDLASAGECSVLAWVRRASKGMHFIAGVWQEEDDHPARQYGLFVSLPLYGGTDQVCGHVSATGGPTPGYRYSREYSASVSTVPCDEWHHVSFTYDGHRILSYFNGLAESRRTYTDPLGNTYSKNPYLFPDGLNPSVQADFTVGAVRLTNGMGNFLHGRLAGLAVFDRALTEGEIAAAAAASMPASPRSAN